MTALTMVTRAIDIGVRVSCDMATGVENMTGYAASVRRRIQGTYGAELRRLADTHPEMSSEELYETVILPAEFPHLAAENPHAAALTASGDRDRARWAKPNAPSPADEAAPSGLWVLIELLLWHHCVSEAKAALASDPMPKPEAAEPEADPEYSAAFVALRARLDPGRQRFAEDRAQRREQAKESA